MAHPALFWREHAVAAERWRQRADRERRKGNFAKAVEYGKNAARRQLIADEGRLECERMGFSTKSESKR